MRSRCTSAIARAANEVDARIPRTGGELCHRPRSVQSGIVTGERALHDVVVVGEVSAGLTGHEAGAGRVSAENRQDYHAPDLGDHPAEPIPEVDGRAADHFGKGRRVGGEVAQRVGRRVWVAVVDSALSAGRAHHACR